MFILNIENKDVKWRIYEKEMLLKIYNIENCITLKIFDNNIKDNILKDYINIAVIVCRLNTEETTLEELNWVKNIISLCKGIPVINNPDCWKYCHCKLEAFNKWKADNISIIDNFEFLNMSDFNQKLAENIFSYPYIIKINNLCGGEGSYLIRNDNDINCKLTELIDIYNKTKNEFSKMLCIKYIESKTRSKKFYTSYRVIATPNDIISGYCRISDNWMCVWAGTVFTTQIQTEFVQEQIRCEKNILNNKELICNSVKSLGLDGVGLDLIVDENDKLYLLEAQPGFSTGYANSHKPPYYRPDDPNMVNFLYNNHTEFSKIMPMYYNGFLNKELLFTKLYNSIKTYKHRKILYCDIDSTINNHWVRIQKWALPQFPGNTIHQNAFTRDEILKDELLPGAKEAIKKFLDNGWIINFLTARNFPNAYNITKEWLDLKGFPYNNIYCVNCSSDKPEFLKDKEVDLFIDDFSGGQEHSASYVNLYDDTIQTLKNYKIPFEVFNGNWCQINLFI